MNRLLSTLRWDIQLQFRNGFYYVSAFVAVVMIIIFRQWPEVDWTIYWPVIILENLVVNAFYFMAGLILLEKGEGTLEAQVVTPLRPWEYLTSKVLSLGLLSLFETVLLIVAVTGFAFNWFWMILGVFILIGFYGLYGFLVTTRYDSITDFILPSALWTIWFSLPLLYFFDLWRHPVMFLHPFQAPLVLLQAAFGSVPTWQVWYGVLYGTLWLGIAFWFAQRAFFRFVLAKQGVGKR